MRSPERRRFIAKYRQGTAIRAWSSPTTPRRRRVVRDSHQDGSSWPQWRQSPDSERVVLGIAPEILARPRYHHGQGQPRYWPGPVLGCQAVSPQLVLLRLGWQCRHWGGLRLDCTPPRQNLSSIASGWGGQTRQNLFNKRHPPPGLRIRSRGRIAPVAVRNDNALGPEVRVTPQARHRAQQRASRSAPEPVAGSIRLHLRQRREVESPAARVGAVLWGGKQLAMAVCRWRCWARAVPQTVGGGDSGGGFRQDCCPQTRQGLCPFFVIQGGYRRGRGRERGSVCMCERTREGGGGRW